VGFIIQLQAGQLDGDDISLCSTASGDDIAGIYKILLRFAVDAC
jgi:hypothetical protein